MKQRACFDETLPNEVTSVKFNKSLPTSLLGSSLDGMIALFDLTKESEEDAADFVMKQD